MNRLTAGNFRTYFRDVHGYEPFPWQRRLTDQVLNEGWPATIDLPTGTGKTAVLDTAVFALAYDPAVAPRRIVFVIDRRIVVDQVCERAQTIRDAVGNGGTPVLNRVRERLNELADGHPLGVAALRGGIPIDAEWTHRPEQPWVLVSTVDQFGSRLLFRGYGVSRRMHPIHAGLAGNDCLVILDEVHLSTPFAETLEQVVALPTGTLPRRYGIVKMSATPGSSAPGDTFRLDPVADLDECEELRRRVRAEKQAELVHVVNRKSVPSAILKIVKALKKSGKPASLGSLGVVVNRIRTAREVHHVLSEAGFDVHLLTGRMRPLDRVTVLKEIQHAVDPERRVASATDDITVVVATQAIEVGADFSFDALITECAPVDSLRQRFGRLDRRGTYFWGVRSPAHAWILGIRPELRAKRPDPIYGDAVKATWSHLQQCAKDGTVDVGSQSLVAGFPEGALAPKCSAPLLLDTHIDAWVQSNPQPIVEPSIEWFLHGIDQSGIPEVSIVWRRDRRLQALRLVPPRQAESLSVPIDAARSWLSGGSEVDFADVQGFALSDDEGQEVRGCVRWRGVGREPEPIRLTADIRPGDTLVVDPSRGGLHAHTWNPSAADAVADLGDAAQAAHGRRVTLRLDGRLVSPIQYSATPPAPGNALDPGSPIRDPRDRIPEWLENELATWTPGKTQADAGVDWRSVMERLSGGFDCVLVQSEALDGDEYYVLAERSRTTRRPVVDPSVLDGSDDAASRTGTAVTLQQHLEGVAARAARIGQSLGLPSHLVNDLRLAAQYHDIGKVDPRFQAQLVGGDEVALAMLDEPLAKSIPGARKVQRYPTGMRHELASVALLVSDPTALATANDPDLVLHLIGAHHGWARPLPPAIQDPSPQRLTYAYDGSTTLAASSDLSTDTLALEMTDRFWHLVERYGHYGLAWLEAILRLADIRESAEEAGRP